MATITDDTTWGEMKVGDVFPNNGLPIIAVESRGTQFDREVVQATVGKPSPYKPEMMLSITLGSNWADEPYSESVARADFYAKLPN